MAITRDCEGFYRRDFLKLGSAGSARPRAGRPAPPRSPSREGCDCRRGRRPRPSRSSWSGLPAARPTIDMWDLKPNAPAEIRGEFKPIATSAPGVEISEHLSKTAKVMDKASLVRSLAHSIPSHEIATTFMTTGNKPTAALQYPSLGSLAAKLLPRRQGRAAVCQLRRPPRRQGGRTRLPRHRLQPVLRRGPPAARPAVRRT